MRAGDLMGKCHVGRRREHLHPAGCPGPDVKVTATALQGGGTQMCPKDGFLRSNGKKKSRSIHMHIKTVVSATDAL